MKNFIKSEITIGLNRTNCITGSNINSRSSSWRNINLSNNQIPIIHWNICICLQILNWLIHSYCKSDCRWVSNLLYQVLINETSWLINYKYIWLDVCGLFLKIKDLLVDWKTTWISNLKRINYFHIKWKMEIVFGKIYWWKIRMISRGSIK